jgi:Glycoside hydrolase 123, catalytic domain
MISLVCLASGLAALATSSAAGPRKPPAVAGEAKPVVVLDTMGFWRMHHELRPPVIRLGDQLKPALVLQRWMNQRTVPAPEGWQKADFDDGEWFRGTALRSIKSPWLSRVCLRGKFQVTEPDKVTTLRLSVDFHGGIIVWVNGRELCRRHLPAGKLSRDTVANPYPPEAFVDEKGIMLFPGNIRWHHPSRKNFWKNRPVTAEMTRRMGLQRRSLQDVSIPAAMLRRGTNVLAVELVRSAYDKSVEEARSTFKAANEQYAYQVFFATCELERLRVTAADKTGLVPNARRAAGFQVWNSPPAATDFDLDFGDPCEPLRPIALLGPRNSMVSGKVVVGDTKPLRGLRAVASDLHSNQGGTIPAACVQIRYGLPWSKERVTESHRRAPPPYPYPATPLLCLSDAPPEVPVSTQNWPRYDPTPVDGAVAGVWATVTIPAGAASGTYSGEMTIEVQGEKPVQVPLRVKVAEWVAPDAKDFTTWVDLIQSPDTLALEYQVPLWSPEHWKMIDRSFALLGQAGNRTLYLPLIGHTNLGNEESLVRWIKKGPNQFEFDFSILDRYLDSAIKNMGRPEIVIASVWELYMLDPSGKLPKDEKYAELRRIRQERMPANVLQHGGKIGLGPMVSVLDPATGTTSLIELPKYSEPAAKAQWTALLGKLREHLAQRGLDQALMFGLNTDAWAPRATVRFFNEILPGTPWVIQSHDGFSVGGKLLHGIAKIGYQTRTWGVAFSDEDRHNLGRVNSPASVRSAGHLYGWNKPERIALFERFSLNPFTYARWRYFAEVNITGSQRGFGRVGADLWRVIKDKRGRRIGTAHERYPESHWRNLTIRTSVLAPGVGGPAATMHFEAMREGLVDAEARIQIEKALLGPALRAKLGEDLATKCQRHLDKRLGLMFLAQSNFQMHAGGYDSGAQYATGWRFTPTVYGQTWYSASGWQERNAQLYALAAKVQQRLAAK